MSPTRVPDRYEVLGEIGRGATGVVLRAHDSVLGRDVAIKLLVPSDVDPEAEERFRREALVVAGLDHPSIVPVLDVGRHDGALYFVMPLLESATLRALFNAGDLRLGEMLEIAAQVAEALDHAHSRGVVHRDVKPENLMVVRPPQGELRVRVMDFGVAWEAGRSDSESGSGPVGTVHYLSPEQARSGEVDGRADLWALGAILYEHLCGSPPFPGPMATVLYHVARDPPPRLQQRGVRVERPLEELVEQCLALEPAARPASGAEVARRLRAVLARDQGTASVPDAARRPRPASRAPGSLIGRRLEWRELTERLRAAGAGDGQLVLLGGEAGIGKSRLLEELGQTARREGCRVLSGWIAEREGGLAYQGFCELILEALRAPWMGEPGTAIDDLAPELLAHFPALAEAAALREAAPALPGERAAVSPVRLYELLSRPLARWARARPLVLLLENLHAGEDSIAALEYLFRRLHKTPTLVVTTWRTTEVDRQHPLSRLLRGFSGDPNVAALVLKPFSPAEARAFVEGLLGSSQLRPGLVRRLHEATGGHPFFSQELVGSLVESRQLSQDDDGTWHLAVELSSTAWPSTVQQAVVQRLERWPETYRRLLAVAAVLGRSFDDRDLEALLDADLDLDAVLDALVEDGVLEERRSRLRFASAVVRDVLYESLPRRRRRSLHRRAGEHLERRWAAHRERVMPRLLEHFFHGAVVEKTVACALEVAQASLAAASPDEAIAAVSKALALLGEDAGRDRAAAQLQLLLARAHDLAGRSEALDAASRAVHLAAAAEDDALLARTALFAAETAWQKRRGDIARGWAERGIPAARQAGELDTLRQLLTLAATVANLRGEHREAEAWLHEAGELVEAAPRSPTVDRCADISEGGTLVIGLEGEVVDLDPVTLRTDEEAQIGQCLYDTLLRSDSDGRLLPALCQSWEGSPDHRTFVLTLRSGVRFSDGRVLCAQDVKSSFERAARIGGSHLESLLSPILGWDELAADGRSHLAGVEVEAARRRRSSGAPVASGPQGERVTFRLREPCPIFPSILTHVALAVVRESGDELVGTGAFRIVRREADRIVLGAHAQPSPRGRPKLERLELRTGLDEAMIARGLEALAIDLAWDLSPEDHERLLARPGFRGGSKEMTKKSLYFALLSAGGARTRHRATRRALTASVSSRDLVWRTLGRFALPASGLFPPGLLGHDAGRQRRQLTREQARALLAEVRLSEARRGSTARPLRLRAAVHPSLLGRYRSLTEALFEEWRQLGVEVDTVVSTGRELVAYHRAALPDLDVWIGRWSASYDDSDSFASLFHSRYGAFRHDGASAQTDRLIEAARREASSETRRRLYVELEDRIVEQALLLPLFHENDTRLAGPSVQGLELAASGSHVDYARLGKARASTPRGGPPRREVELHVPISPRLDTLDPGIEPLIEKTEITTNVFDTLTGVEEGARVGPWLAASWSVADRGRRYRFRLRPGLHFHDGRRLGTRDVRYSFERVLRDERILFGHSLLLPVRGARAFRDGASEISGLELVSDTELVIELEDPLLYLPALLTHPSLAILPEGTSAFDVGWQDGCAGSGPFRVASFQSGKIELERNPQSWRAVPRAERLVFHCGLSPGSILEAFRDGRLSLAWNLRSSDVDALCRDPQWRRGYHEAPRLASFFLVLNARRGPFADRAARRAVQRAFDRRRSAGGARLVRASSLVPPGLIGHEPELRAAPPGDVELPRDLDLKVAIHPEILSQYPAVWMELHEVLDGLGVRTVNVAATFADYFRHLRDATCDLALVRRVADYPDADSFATPVLHSEEGFLGPLVGSPAIDRWIERGRSESDPALRHAVYSELGERLASQALVVPLYYEQTYRFARPEVRGLRFRLMNPEVCYEELDLVR